jgi:4-hydroxybenzoyl-CoA reductase subunit alpha
MEKFSYIGKDTKRVDTASKATGEALFAADLALPRMLVGKVLRSPHAHARIVAIDTAKAEKLSGVKAVVTAKDTCGDKWGVFKYTQDQQFLPTEKVRYVGEEVAAVAAVDEDTAFEALSLMRSHMVLPAVYHRRSLAPMRPRSPRQHVFVDVGALGNCRVYLSGRIRLPPRRLLFQENHTVPSSTMRETLKYGCPTPDPI